MKSYKLSKRSNDWVVITAWPCKSEYGKTCCICCQPKHVVSPSVLKHPNPEFREFFRQLDSIGKSKTPRSSKSPHKKFEPNTCKE